MRRIPYILLLLSLHSHAQKLGIEGIGGVLNYQGDLRQNFYTFQGVRFGIGAGITYDFNNRLQVVSRLMTGSIAADDRYNRDPNLFNRNLRFASSISELSLQLAVSFFDLQNTPVTPYAMAGAAFFRFNPYTNDLVGTRHYLQPLGTEGQGLPGYTGKPYALTQFSFPFGGGISARVTKSITVSWEVAFRKTFTDYLDDVSSVYADEADLVAGRGSIAAEIAYRGDEIPGVNPLTPNGYPVRGFIRGNPRANDFYYFTGLRLNFKLNYNRSSLDPRWRKGMNRTGCPKWNG